MRSLVWFAISITCAAANGPIRLQITESDDIRFTRFSTREGLSHNRVEHILQDDQGFLWFGTENGLSRFDGYSFKVFRHDTDPHSLSGVTIGALFKDRAGVLWIGVDQILNKFNRATETFEHYRLESTLGVIFGVFQDQTGRIWIAANHGLASLDQATGSFTYFRHDASDLSSLASDDLRFAMQDRAGVLWLVSAIGIDSLDPRTNQISHHDQFKAAINAFWPDTRLYEDSRGLLWMFSTSSPELATINRNSGAIRRFSWAKKNVPALVNTGIQAIHEDEEGRFWLGTGGNGLFRFDRPTQALEQYRSRPNVSASLSNNFVFSLFEDREGTMWAGTGGGGISRFQRKPPPFHSYQYDPTNPNSLRQNYVISAYPDSRGLLWIGNDKVLNCLDRATGRYLFYRHNPADPESISMASVTSVVEDPDGFLWFGTYGGGLNRFDRRTKRFKSWRANGGPHDLGSDLIFTLMLDRDGALWIGTDDGLDRFDPRTQRFTQFHQSTPVPTLRIVQDAEGWLWLGTMGGGLYSFDPHSGQFIGYKHSDDSRTGLSDDHVNALHIDRSGVLWIGTQNGLDSLDLRRRTFIASYRDKDGLADNAVQGIEEDNQGNLWISTSRGLSRFQPRTKHFINFYDSDGLPGNDFSVLFPVSAHSSSGEMFFGGVDGLTSFYPDQVGQTDNRYVPPVVLTDFRLNNESVKASRGIPLSAASPQAQRFAISSQQNVLSFEFSALSYVNPARNRYRYRLEGLPESAWYEAPSDRRFVTYTTLPPGDYVFRVQGSNNTGVWNESGLSVAMRVMPPWWRTLWFRIISGFCLTLVVWSAYRYRLHLVARELNLRADERVAERTRIAQDLHDTLLQGFISASLQLSLANRELAADSKAKYIVTEVLDLMRTAIEEGRKAVRGMRLMHVDSNDLEKSFSRIRAEEIADDPASLHVLVEGHERSLHALVRDDVYRIGREAIINAFRHSGASNVEVDLRYSDRDLCLFVRDDGRGIEPRVLRDGRDGHWGLSGMRETAERIGGKLRLQSRLGEGTEVELTVPAEIAFAAVPGPPANRWWRIFTFQRKRRLEDPSNEPSNHNS